MSKNNIHQIMLATHQYAEYQNGELPGDIAVFGEEEYDVSEGLSWRVKILPFIDQQYLYDQFNLDEPWDSPNNIKLLSQMPMIYRSPSSSLPGDEYRTNYLAIKGPGMALDSAQDRGVSYHQIRDGESNTIFLVEVDDERAVPWTKPDDLDAENPYEALEFLGHLGPGRRFNAAFVDGAVISLDRDIDPEVFHALCTRDGGEIIDESEL